MRAQTLSPEIKTQQSVEFDHVDNLRPASGTSRPKAAIAPGLAVARVTSLSGALLRFQGQRPSAHWELLQLPWVKGQGSQLLCLPVPRRVVAESFSPAKRMDRQRANTLLHGHCSSFLSWLGHVPLRSPHLALCMAF